MTEIIKGKLLPYFETGFESIMWALQKDDTTSYDGLIQLSEGDYLVIYEDAARTRVVWQGNIEFNLVRNFQPYSDDAPLFGQQAIGNVKVHGIQKGVDEKRWLNWFEKEYSAELVQSNFGHFYPIDSIILESYSYKGKIGYTEGTTDIPGELIIKFVSGPYYSYKDVPGDVFIGLRDAPSKGRYFMEHIRDMFKTEKLELPFHPTCPKEENYDKFLEWTEEEEEAFLKLTDGDDDELS